MKHKFHSYLLQHYSKGKNLALDIGCAMRPYHDDYKCNYIGIDLLSRPYDTKKPDVFTDGCNLPFQNNSFDLIVAYATMQYVKNLDNMIREIHRVLKENGITVIILLNETGLNLHPSSDFANRCNLSQLQNMLRQYHFKSVMVQNLKALLLAKYYDKTSVYSYEVVSKQPFRHPVD